MSEYRSLLERTAARVQDRPDAFERLAQARVRRRRYRRITTGALALVIAAGGISAALVAFGRPSEGPRPLSGAARVARILWPQPGRVPANCCRTPQEAVRGFTGSVLRWPRTFLLGHPRPSTSTPGAQVLSATTCPRGSFCPVAVPAALISVAQVSRPEPGAGWSVVKVESPVLRIGVRPGASIGVGGSIIRVRSSGGARLRAGWAYSGACPELRTLKATVHHGTIRLPEVRFVLLGCRNGKVRPPAGGYVFVCACRGNAIGNSSRPEDLFATLAHLNMSGHTYAFAVVPVRFVSGPAVAPTASPTPGYPMIPGRSATPPPGRRDMIPW